MKYFAIASYFAYFLAIPARIPKPTKPELRVWHICVETRTRTHTLRKVANVSYTALEEKCQSTTRSEAFLLFMSVSQGTTLEDSSSRRGSRSEARCISEKSLPVVIVKLPQLRYALRRISGCVGRAFDANSAAFFISPKCQLALASSFIIQCEPSLFGLTTIQRHIEIS